jgi:hypothetical protein
MDGTIVNCSRTQNQELFRLAMGGYGLVGIILGSRSTWSEPCSNRPRGHARQGLRQAFHRGGNNDPLVDGLRAST